MRAISRSFFLASAIALVACGGTQNGSSDPGDEPGGGSCSPEACGPRPGAPNHPCPDGVTIAGPTCERDANGRCAWAMRECPPEPRPGGGEGSAGQDQGTMCGGIAGVACPEGQFCSYPREARCGAGDQSGVCQPRPDVCAQLFQPVCGCDGRTYPNACAASQAGVSMASDGECEGAETGDGAGTGGGERACGSRGLAPCGADELCDWAPSAQCGATDVPGVCRPRPQMCTREYAPVCGCDGQTYPTRCVAHSQGISVAHDGPC